MTAGSNTFQIMERNALCQADEDILQARKLVALAQKGSPQIRDLPPVAIAQGNLLGDVLFDNIFSDMQFHGKIKQSAIEVQNCAQGLSVELQNVTHRHMEISREAEVKSAAMRKARARLQKSREAVFAIILGQDGMASLTGDVAPPPGPPPMHSAAA